MRSFQSLQSNCRDSCRSRIDAEGGNVRGDDDDGDTRVGSRTDRKPQRSCLSPLRPRQRLRPRLGSTYRNTGGNLVLSDVGRVDPSSPWNRQLRLKNSRSHSREALLTTVANVEGERDCCVETECSEKRDSTRLRRQTVPISMKLARETLLKCYTVDDERR